MTQSNLDRYSQAILAIEKYKEEHKDVFLKLNFLEEAKIKTEWDLKEEVKESKKDLENAFFKVSYVERWKKWYDYNVFNDKQKKQLLKSGIAKVEIDKSEFEGAVKAEKIPRSWRVLAFKEALLTKTAIIKPKI